MNTSTNTRGTMNDAHTGSTASQVAGSMASTSRGTGYHMPEMRETEIDCRCILEALTDQQLEDAKRLLLYCYSLTDQHRGDVVQAAYRLSTQEWYEGGDQA